LGGEREPLSDHRLESVPFVADGLPDRELASGHRDQSEAIRSHECPRFVVIAGRHAQFVAAYEAHHKPSILEHGGVDGVGVEQSQRLRQGRGVSLRIELHARTGGRELKALSIRSSKSSPSPLMMSTKP
jgi:hypothetical protein